MSLANCGESSVLKIYNTLTRSKQVFQPIVAGEVGLYVCGVTVYDYCHIGHARVMVAFDVISRYLRERGYKVRYIRNITDIDDKIFKRAKENSEDYRTLTARFIEAMHEDERALFVLPPDVEPKASEHIDEIIAMIATLVNKQMAYPADNGDVYYAVESFESYGRLTNKKIDELLVGARIEAEEAKKNPLDFVLWKAAKPAEASWPSPWGAGRPGWHIECSAMSTKCLGATFDIHGGGPDLPFPHHENEIAQSEAATGKTYVHTWMHAGAVRVDNEKMSKSLGNFFTIRDVLKKYHPEVVRYFLISSHYRSPISYSEENLKIAHIALKRFYVALRDVPVDMTTCDKNSVEYARFIAAMDDDFNTPEALAVMFDVAKDLNVAKENQSEQAKRLAAQLRAMGDVLGLLSEDPALFVQTGALEIDESFRAEVERLIALRKSARAAKDWAQADSARDQLKAKHVVVEDKPDGSSVWRIEE